MVDLNAVIAEHAPILAERLRQSAANRTLEAELVLDADEWFGDFARDAAIHWEPRPERRVVFHEAADTGKASARIDRLFSRVVVEFEPPASLSHLNEATKNRHAIGQVREQIDALVQHEGWKEDQVSGVVLDGNWFIFVRRTAGRWIIEAPLEVDAASTARFLRLIASLSREPLLPAQVVKRFGIQQQDTAVQTVRALFEALADPKHKRARALFGQWLEFYKDVAGLDSSKLAASKEIGKFAHEVLGRRAITASAVERLLFALYTYGALLMKYLAVAAVTPFFTDKITEPLSHISGLDDADAEELQKRLRDVESGAWFRRLHIRNLCEGDFFGWYVDEWTPSIARTVKRVLNILAEFDPTAVEQTPERVRDLMKALYHGLLPREVRHTLGEYYTPDWLAERVLMQVDADLWDELQGVGQERRLERYAHDIVPGLTTKRWLDPTCGSGTFLVLIINKIKTQWRQARQITDPRSNREIETPSRAQLREALQKNVTGFDLNPLAVIAARVNWLLSAVDLIEYGDEVEIPIYLADSVALPAEGAEGLFSDGAYHLPMRGLGKEFAIPGEVATQERLPELAHYLERDVQAQVPTDAFLRSCRTALRLRSDVWARTEPILRDLYETLAELERNGQDGLWAAVTKNMFMPLFLDPVDYVVGNPPWVNWESLPEHYRERTKPLWLKYGLFVHSGMDVMLGKGKKDVAMLVTFVAADRYLKPGGTLSFVITQSVFKTSGAAQGFRAFRLGTTGETLGVYNVEDHSSYQPFDGATNRTATIHLRKGATTNFGTLPYTVWRKRGRPSPDFAMDWRQTEPLLRSTRLAAEPVDRTDRTSPWLTATRAALAGMRKVLGRSDYQARAGAYSGGVNPVFWLEVLRDNPDGTVTVRMITEGAKTDVPAPHTHTVEPDLLYPLVRGRDIKRWSARADPRCRFLITQDPKRRIGVPEADLAASYPRLHAYLRRYESLLRGRAAYKRYFVPTDPFWSMFNIGEYTLAPVKVVWPNIGSAITAAVLTADDPTSCGQVPVPQHIVTLVACDSDDEAHFICAVVNSGPFDLTVRSYSQEGGKSFGTPHVLQMAHVPKFDQRDPTHTSLADLSRAAHAVTGGQVGQPLADIGAEIDDLAATLWGITADELKAIQDALRDRG